MGMGLGTKRENELNEYVFVEITLGEMAREDFRAVKKLVDRALDSTMLDALGYVEDCGATGEHGFSEENFFGEYAAAYKVLYKGTLIGGAFLILLPEDQEGHLSLFGLDPAFHGRGLGQRVWKHIEQLHPDIKVWELVTPTFAFRNVVFYVNKCGFQIVEIMKDSHDPKWDSFRFQKRLA